MWFDLSLLTAGTYHDWLITGLKVSLALAGLTLVFSLPLAALVALLRLAPSRALQVVGFSYVESIRNVPLLAHMLFWYFGAPELLPDGLKQALYAGNIEFISALVALTLYTAAYMAEDFRSGVRSISSGQLEAGRSLGFGHLATMRHIVLPQAVRIIVPPLVSQTLNLWKNTSIATVIGVGEMMYQAAKVETNTFRSVEAFAFVTVCYLTLSIVLTALGALYRHHYPVRTA